MTGKKTKKTKTRRPLTISIHGHNLDIEAKLGDSQLADLFADAIKRVTGPSAATPSAASPTPLAELVGEFGKSLRKDQLELLTNSFDMSQKILFMEIMNTVKVEHAGN